MRRTELHGSHALRPGLDLHVPYPVVLAVPPRRTPGYNCVEIAFEGRVQKRVSIFNMGANMGNF